MSRNLIHAYYTTPRAMILSNHLLHLLPAHARFSVRKERKIRPGFTPQEDVQRFRGTRQSAADARSGIDANQRASVPGAAPGARSLFAAAVGAANASVPGAGRSVGAGSGAEPMSKAAKKNAARRKKKAEKREEAEEVPDNWDDEPEEDAKPTKAEAKKTEDASTDAVVEKLEKLEVGES